MLACSFLRQRIKYEEFLSALSRFVHLALEAYYFAVLLGGVHAPRNFTAKPLSNASTAKSRAVKCRHPFGASCFANRRPNVKRTRFKLHRYPDHC